MSAENAKGRMHSTANALATAASIANKTHKPESTGHIRLASFLPPRDLTLGGRYGPMGSIGKKEFKPNLNVVRNKNTNVKTSKDTTARGGRGRGRGERSGRNGAHRGRGGGPVNSTLIQTTGVFSEGAGAVSQRRSASSGSTAYTRVESDSASSLRRPVLAKNALKNLDSKDDAKVIHDLLGDSDDNADDNCMEAKTDSDQAPIKLFEGKWKQVITETKVNRNPIVNGAAVLRDDALEIAQQMNTMKVRPERVEREEVATGSLRPLPRFPCNLNDMLLSTQPQIFLMQLPDTLPTCEHDEVAGNEAPEPAAKDTDQPVTTTETLQTQNATKPSALSEKHCCNRQPLQNLEEGQVGKLVRYKSGKIKLILGESHFDVDVGMETGFQQDLMSICTNREERSGNMINLGPIQAKLTATPDWEQLLNQEQVGHTVGDSALT